VGDEDNSLLSEEEDDTLSFLMIENQIKRQNELWPEHFLARVFSQESVNKMSLKEVITKLI
jgi:hypothetical protein